MSKLEIVENGLVPVYKSEKGNQLVNARELHEFLQVQQDFSDWIKKQLESIDAQQDKEFTLLKGKTSEIGGRPSTEYILTMDTAKEICMIAGIAPRTNEETKKLSKQARQYFIQIEKAWNSPEMVMKRALEFANAQVENLKFQIQEQHPKVLFAESVQASKTSILIRELAKLIKQNGYEIGEGRLFKWLRANGYLIKRKGTDYNTPTQKSMELDLFEIKETAINHSDGHVGLKKTPKVTGKGQIYFINKFIELKKIDKAG